MPRSAKQRRWNKKKRAEEVKHLKKQKSKIKKIKRTRPDGTEYNEYVPKKELEANDR